MNDLTPVDNLPENSRERVEFRQKMLFLQEQMRDRFDQKAINDACELAHYFSPIDEKYGCCTYARQILLPKGSVVIGKIHRHAHLNFIMQGKVSVNTEFGKKYFTAPCTFVSEPGLKRAVYAEEDTIWTTVHMTQFCGEEFLKKIEDEVIAPDYETLGLISLVDRLAVEEKQP